MGADPESCETSPSEDGHHRKQCHVLSKSLTDELKNCLW